MRNHQWVVLVCMFLVAIGIANVIMTVSYPERLRSWGFDGDAIAFMGAVRSYLNGTSLYFISTPPASADLQPYLTRFLYPPPAVWVLLPFFVWHGAVAGPLWMLLTIVLFLAVAYSLGMGLARHLEVQTPELMGGLIAVTLALWYPLVHHLGVGQVDVAVMGLCYYATIHRKRNAAAAAVALTLATALKAYPAALAFYLVLADGRKSARFAIYYAIALSATTVAALASFGADSFSEWLRVISYKNAQANPYIVNQSFIASLNRTIGPDSGHWHRMLVPLVRHLLQTVMPVLTCVVLWRRSRRFAALPLLDPYNAFIVCYASISPIFWVQSYVLLLPLVVSLTGGALRTSWACLRLTAAGMLMGALLIQFTVWFNPPPAHSIVGVVEFMLYHRYTASLAMLVAAWMLMSFDWSRKPSSTPLLCEELRDTQPCRSRRIAQ